MSRSVTDARQVTIRQLLDQIAGRTHHEGTSDAKPANQTELDNLLISLNSETTSPLRMTASNPADLIVNVGSALIVNPENSRTRSIPHVGSLLPNDFTSGTVTFSTPGGAITVAPGNNNTLSAMGANEYVKVLIYMDANGDLNVLPGVANAVEADATVLPSPRNTLPIGYVTLQEDGGGGLLTIDQAEIVQFGVGAGGSGGAGDANSFTETLKNRLCDSIFEAATPYVAEADTDDAALIDASSTGTFDLVTNLFKLAGIGDTLVSANLLDATFLADNKSINQVELLLQFASTGFDSAPTVELSRNGGNEYQDGSANLERVDDSSMYRLLHTFADEASDQTLDEYAVGNEDTDVVLTDVIERFGQIFTFANLAELRKIEIYLNKLGTPAGKYFVQIVADDTGSPGDPSTDVNDILFESEFKNIADLAGGDNTISFDLKTPLAPGDYHIVIQTDQDYKDNQYSVGVDELRVRMDGSAPAISVANKFEAAAWGAIAQAMTYKLEGIELDLRLRVTASATDRLISEFGVLYEENIGNLAFATTLDGITRSTFNAVADNFVEFTVPFLINPDLAVVHLLGSGQSFRYGDFSIKGGSTFVFPADQFNNGGVEKVQTLVFDQNRGGAFDNSDVNAALMAENGLGSTNGAYDKSAAGVGIKLRRPDGVLREIRINNLDELEILDT